MRYVSEDESNGLLSGLHLWSAAGPTRLPEAPALCCSPFSSREESAERNGRRTSLTLTGLGGEARSLSRRSERLLYFISVSV